ncbi:Bro-N domain-containing protein [Corynebacterium sp. Marseille-P4321]|uniref:BRO-N domain-containing protein n=1 Tax=Corynebacterium sp. Marseille-P4321 TaxID=2736603 RepID=UPI0015887FB5|nr:Bro-N domain-containing protein [Corynebacterium sp. Marseille-P4321]
MKSPRSSSWKRGSGYGGSSTGSTRSKRTGGLNRLDGDEVSSTGTIDRLGRSQQVTTVNESGLYDVIFQSRKPEAKRFRRSLG